MNSLRCRKKSNPVIKLIKQILIALAFIILLSLVTACSRNEHLVYVKVKCPQLVRPQLNTVGVLMKYNQLLENAYEKCNEREIVK